MAEDVDSTRTRTRPELDGGGGAEVPSLYLFPAYTDAAAAPPGAPGDAPIWLDEGHKLVVGRDPGGSGLALPWDEWASRRHARVSAIAIGEDRGLLVEDLDARNGTFVDGARVTKRTVARPGAVLRIGGTVFIAGMAPRERRAEILSSHPPPSGWVAQSWRALELWDRVVQAAPSDEGILLLGELGTGKTRLAELIHGLSPRRQGPFVPHNCSAIPINLEEATLFGVVGGFIPGVKAREGLLTRARGGTLFLDELSDLPLVAQAKLLDAFDPTRGSYLPVGGAERRATACRLVSATNRDPFALAADGVVRHDLLSRIVVIQLTVPPLRERREDVLPLFFAALERAGVDPRVPAEIAAALALAPWTENVRGLESLARRVQRGERLSLELVREHAGRGPGSRQAAPAGAPQTASGPPVAPPVVPERWPPSPETLLTVLEQHHWNVAAAAETFGKRRETVSRQIKSLFGSGGKGVAHQAWQIWQASGRMPGAGQVEALFELFCGARASDSGAEAARAAWRARGELKL